MRAPDIAVSTFGFLLLLHMTIGNRKDILFTALSRNLVHDKFISQIFTYIHNIVHISGNEESIIVFKQ